MEADEIWAYRTPNNVCLVRALLRRLTADNKAGSRFQATGRPFAVPGSAWPRCPFRGSRRCVPLLELMSRPSPAFETTLGSRSYIEER